MEKSYNSVVVSCAEIADGESYTLITDETTTEITMDGLIYGDGFGFGGHGGFDGSDGHSGLGEHGGPGSPDGRGGFGDSNVPDAPDEFKDEKRPFID